MAEVVGRNVQTLRRRRPGATLEDLASAARRYGLRWSTGSVGSFESGRTVGVNLENLLIVAAALGDVIGRPVTLAELFAGKGSVALSEDVTLPLAKLRAALSGTVMLPAAKTSGDVTVSPAGAALTLTGGSASGVVTPKGAGISPSQHLRVFNDFRETDERICKSLGVDPEVGAAVMAKRWKETFVARRDRLAGSGANAQKRGRVSRQLKAELREALR